MKAENRRGKPFYGPNSPGWGFCWFTKYCVAKPFSWLWRTKLEGIENLPAGRAVLACNHMSMMDPVLLWCISRPKQPHFVAKSDVYAVHIGSWHWLGWILDMFGAMPINRGSADRAMISHCTNLLNEDEWVAIFPEGTRGRTTGGDGSQLGEALGGAAFLATRTNSPIVPIGVAGTEHVVPPGSKFPRFPKVIFKVGAPIYPDSFEGGRKEKVSAMTHELMHQIDVLHKAAEAERTA